MPGTDPKYNYTHLSGHGKYLAMVLEAIIRSHGGQIRIAEGRTLNLSGELVIRPVSTYSGEVLIEVTTRDRAEGRWAPAGPDLNDFLSERDLREYAYFLMQRGVTEQGAQRAADVVRSSAETAFDEPKVKEFIKKICDELVRVAVQEIETAEKEDAAKVEQVRKQAEQQPLARRVQRRGF